jgi:hypothetical protein
MSPLSRLTLATLFWIPSLVAQEPSPYDLGRRMAALEQRVENLEKARSITRGDLDAIRSDVATLERQMKDLSPQDMLKVQKSLDDLKPLLRRLDAVLAATSPDREGSATTAGAIQSPGSVKQIGQEQFRVIVPKQPGWFDTRLPYAGSCVYNITRIGPGRKYEVSAGSKTFWYDSAVTNPQTLALQEAGTIKIRVNEEARENYTIFEVSRSLPIEGYCYGPAFEPLTADKTMCDIEYPMFGDDTPPFQRGLNTIAPLFGRAPSVSERKRAFNPSCPPGSIGGPPGASPASPSPHIPALSLPKYPMGSHIILLHGYLEGRNQSAVAVVGANGVSDVKHLPFMPGVGEISADGRFLAYDSCASTPRGVVVSRLDGSDRRLLAPLSGTACHDVRWSPDGMRISYEDANAQLFVVRVDNDQVTQLTRSGIVGFHSWSPSGNEIVFEYGGGGSRSLHVVNMAGFSRLIVPLVAQTLRCEAWAPDWSPDGAEIAFTSCGNLYTVQPHGAGLRQIAARAYSPRWSPDGMWIYFLSGADELMRVRRNGQSLSSVGSIRPYGGRPFSLAVTK